MARAKYLFSYGIFRLPLVQTTLFGRLLAETPDSLLGWRTEVTPVRDPSAGALVWRDALPGLVASGDPGDRVDGVVFALTPEQLAAADRYQERGYTRITTRSGRGRLVDIYVRDAALSRASLNQFVDRSAGAGSGSGPRRRRWNCARPNSDVGAPVAPRERGEADW